MKAAHCATGNVREFVPAPPKGNHTSGQTKAMFGLAKKRGLSDEELYDHVEAVSGGRSISALDRNQADAVITRLGGTAFTTRTAYGKSQRRTQQIKKAANIQSIASKAQLDKMERLASGRGIGEDGLARMCQRTIRRDYPVTTKEANRMIEALKKMNERDELRERNSRIA